MNKMVWIIFLVILVVGIAYLISRYNKSTVNSRERIPDENLRDQLVLAPKLAELFANDELFVSEIGLEQFGPEERRFQLEPRIGFILAMHRTMKSIFRYQPHLNLDDKFVTLIHSRISLIPEQVEEYPDPNEYAKQCYIEAKQNAKDLGIEWEGISLKEKFFEVCLRTEAEEEKLLLMNPTDTKDELWKIGHRNIFSLLFQKTFEYTDWELGEYGQNHDVSETQQRKESVILEHPFFEDYVEAVQSYSGKTLGTQGLEKTKQIYCSLFPKPILTRRWDGWQLGIPRPKGSMPDEAFNLLYGEATVFLRQFFKRVENDRLYCEWSAVIDRLGEEDVASRMAGKTGLHYNLERVYWTFNIKFNNWIEQNIENYNCTLVCDLDEIIARADSILREAFFPTPGPFDIGPKRRKEYQIKVLREVAPNLEKPLIEQIWRELKESSNGYI